MPFVAKHNAVGRTPVVTTPQCFPGAVYHVCPSLQAGCSYMAACMLYPHVPLALMPPHPHVPVRR